MNEEFAWNNQEFQPIIHVYNAAHSELKNVDPDVTPMACFKQFFSADLLEHIVNETNRYANISFQISPSTSRQAKGNVNGTCKKKENY